MIEIQAGPDYVSYSAFTGWLQCGKKYELRRIYNVAEIPGWAQVGGSALHSATEALDRSLWAEGIA